MVSYVIRICSNGSTTPLRTTGAAQMSQTPGCCPEPAGMRSQVTQSQISGQKVSSMSEGAFAVSIPCFFSLEMSVSTSPRFKALVHSCLSSLNFAGNCLLGRQISLHTGKGPLVTPLSNLWLCLENFFISLKEN